MTLTRSGEAIASSCLTSEHRGWRVALLVALLFTTTPGQIKAQRRGGSPPAWSDAGEIYWGGSINVRFGRTSGIGLYPLVGYKITSQWSVGVRVG